MTSISSSASLSSLEMYRNLTQQYPDNKPAPVAKIGVTVMVPKYHYRADITDDDDADNFSTMNSARSASSAKGYEQYIFR